MGTTETSPAIEDGVRRVDDQRSAARRPCRAACSCWSACAAAVIVIAGMRASADILAPGLPRPGAHRSLAHPLRRWLDRWMPSWAASRGVHRRGLPARSSAWPLAVVVSIGAVRDAAADSTPTSSTHGSTTSPTGSTTLGVAPGQIDKVAVVLRPRPAQRLHRRPARRRCWAWSRNLFFILTLVLFLAVDATGFPSSRRPRSPASVGAACRRLRQRHSPLPVVSTIFGLIVACSTRSRWP